MRATEFLSSIQDGIQEVELYSHLNMNDKKTRDKVTIARREVKKRLKEWKKFFLANYNFNTERQKYTKKPNQGFKNMIINCRSCDFLLECREQGWGDNAGGICLAHTVNSVKTIEAYPDPGKDLATGPVNERVVNKC